MNKGQQSARDIPSPSSPCSTFEIEGARAYKQGWHSPTHDLKNGSPRLQLNSAPTLGGSVDTRLLTTHVCASPVLFCDTKSRGSIGNTFPPIWNDRLCAVAQGNVGSTLGFAANAGDTDLRTEETRSCGPRRSELP